MNRRSSNRSRGPGRVHATGTRLLLPVLSCALIATWGSSAIARHDLESSPIITLSPECGSGGPKSERYSIQVEGYNFSRSAAVTVTFAADTEDVETFSAAATTDREGRFSATIQPPRRGQGDYLVRAITDEHDAHARFQVPCAARPGERQGHGGGTDEEPEQRNYSRRRGAQESPGRTAADPSPPPPPARSPEPESADPSPAASPSPRRQAEAPEPEVPSSPPGFSEREVDRGASPAASPSPIRRPAATSGSPRPPSPGEPPRSRPTPPRASQPEDVLIKAATAATIRELAPGHIVFNTPEQARVADRERVEVRISRAFSGEVEDQVKSQLKDGLRGRGIPQLDNIRVGDRMKVELIDNDQAFIIRPLSATEQQIRPPFTLWEWNVTPQKSGVHALTLSVTAVLVVPGQDPEHNAQPVYDRDIQVNVNLPYSTSKFWGDHWQWILGTPMVSGLMAWGASMVWKKPKRALPPPS